MPPYLADALFGRCPIPDTRCPIWPMPDAPLWLKIAVRCAEEHPTLRQSWQSEELSTLPEVKKVDRLNQEDKHPEHTNWGNPKL
jgi:hypothetical protein